VGGYPPVWYHASRRKAWYYRGAIVVPSWYHRGAIMVLACYRNATGMIRQGRSLLVSSMWGAEHPRAPRLAVGYGGAARRGLISDVIDPEGRFGAEMFFNREIFASRRGVPLKKRNIVEILLSFTPPGVPLGHSAPSPIAPAGKLDTTSTVLSSGKTFKPSGFGLVLSSSAPLPAYPLMWPRIGPNAASGSSLLVDLLVGLLVSRQAVPDSLLDRLSGLGEPKGLAGDQLIEQDIAPREFDPEGVRCRRQGGVVVWVAVVREPEPQELLVDVVRFLTPGEALFVALGEPVAAGVGGMDLVDEQDITVGVLAELVFGVHQDQAMLPGHLLPEGKQLQGVRAGGLPVRLGGGAVVFLVLGGGGQDRLLQDGVLFQAVGQRVPAVVADPVSVVGPQGSAGGPGDIAPDDHLDGKHLAFPGHQDVGVGNLDDVVVNDVLRLLEPPGAGDIECLSFERDRRQHPVEGALAVGGDEDEPVPQVIGIPDLARHPGPDPQVGFRQAVLQFPADRFGVVDILLQKRVWEGLDVRSTHGL